MIQGPADRPRFFGRRRGKSLKKRAQELMETLLPRLAVPVPGQGETIDPFSLFEPAPQGVWLEVGFGGGEHLAAQAVTHPRIGFIGCEPFRNGVASLLGHVDEAGLQTVRVFYEDARLLLPALPEASIGRAFILFPDPWPKLRHAERRFVCAANLDLLARALADHAELRVASDDPVYAAWAAKELGHHHLFEEMLTTRDRSLLPADWVPTRYEQKCLAKRPPTFFLYRRKAR
ncbi:MAG: tRNA (guanine(46)-N(7))-methyltransferase TrmB [Actinomycetota bacterium]